MRGGQGVVGSWGGVQHLLRARLCAEVGTEFIMSCSPWSIGGNLGIGLHSSVFLTLHPNPSTEFCPCCLHNLSCFSPPPLASWLKLLALVCPHPPAPLSARLLCLKPFMRLLPPSHNWSRANLPAPAPPTPPYQELSVGRWSRSGYLCWSSHSRRDCGWSPASLVPWARAS